MINFCKGPSKDRFVSVLYEDICQIQKKISQHENLMDQEFKEQNNDDDIYIKRMNNFRNL